MDQALPQNALNHFPWFYLSRTTHEWDSCQWLGHKMVLQLPAVLFA